MDLGVINMTGAKINDLGEGTGNNEAWLVNESGLYSLILTSRKPAAKRFKKWVTSEVLPSIRKTGSFGAAPGITAAEVAAICAEMLAKVLANHSTGAERAEAEEFRKTRVFEDGITVGELVDGLNLPKGPIRQSVSQQLNGRLRTHSQLHGLHSFKLRKGWLFARIRASRLVVEWQDEMIALAERNKAKRDQRNKAQMEFPDFKLHSVRTDKPVKPPGAV
jgi:hypothetical protein